MQKLIEYDGNIRRGNLLRFAADYPYEKYIDILVAELHHENGRFGLIVASGHKAGLVLIHLPSECELENEIGISKEWLLLNWHKWVYHNDIHEIYIIENYPEPSI